MKTLNNYTKILIGKNENENIYLTPPSWDCDWYWSFGYIGNKNCHYHLDSLLKNNIEGLKEHFDGTFIIRNSQMWEFAELTETVYKLKETVLLFQKTVLNLDLK